MHKKSRLLTRLSNYLWSLFLGGLLTILPITLTILLFNASFKIVISWLEPLHTIIEPTIFGQFPYSEILLALLIILFVGIIMRILLLRTIVHTIEDLVFKIPLIRPVYSGIKQLVRALSIDKMTFQQVVLVEFPRKGIYSLGFMTSKLPAEIAPESGEKFYNIFVPTTPNPTSGYFVIIAEKNIRMIDLTRQEAMAMIISGGIIQPERLHTK